MGFLSSAVAETAWSYYDLIAATEVPSPSLADLFYVLFCPAAIVGTPLLLRRRRVGRLAGWTASLDAVTFFTLGLAGLAWQLLFLRWELERVEKPVFLILVSLVTMVTADLVYAWLALRGEYGSASPVDPLWVLPYSLLGLAALARLRELQRPARGEPSEAERHVRTAVNLAWRPAPAGGNAVLLLPGSGLAPLPTPEPAVNRPAGRP